MSYAISGSTVQQSGTDANFSGLEGLAGVTVFKSNGRTVYQLDNLGMEINGTVDHDPESEELVFVNYGNIKTFVVKGTYNLGLEIDVGADENRFSSGTAIRFTRNSDSTYSEDSSDIYIDTSGTMNWRGGTIFSKRQFAIYGHFNTFSQNAKLIGQHTADFQIRQRSGSTNINGWVTNGYMLAMITNAAQIKGFKPYAHIGLSILTPSSASPSNVFMTVEDFDSSGDTGRIISFWSSKWMRLVNNLKGTDVLCEGLLPNNGNNKGLAEFTKAIKFEYTDLDGNVLTGIKNYSKDVDGGHRLAAGQINSNPDYIADRIYEGTSDANGVVDHPSVLLGVVWRTTGGHAEDNNVYDYRGKNTDATDIFQFSSIEYMYAIKVQNVPMKGTGYISLNTPLLPDVKITETNKSVAEAYTTFETAQRIYDYLKAELYNNFQGETETIVDRAGDQLNVRGRNFTVDNTLQDAITYDDQDMAINVLSYESGVATTGDTIFNAGSYPAGGTFDCDVYLNEVPNKAGSTLENVTINGDLHINVPNDESFVFSNVQVTGSTYNDNASKTLSISLKNGSQITPDNPGDGPGQISSMEAVEISVNVVDSLGVPVENARVYIGDTLATELANELTDANGNMTYMYSGVGTNAILNVRNEKYAPYSTTIDLTKDNTLNVTLAGVPQVTDEARTDITIDWTQSPRIITIAKPSTECTMQELLDTLSVEQAKEANMKEPPIASASGKEDIGAGEATGLTVKLLNAQVEFEGRMAWTACSLLGGNLLAQDDQGNNMMSVHSTPYVNIIKSLSTSATIKSVGTGLTEEEHDALMDAIGLTPEEHNVLMDSIGLTDEEHEALMNAIGLTDEEHDALMNAIGLTPEEHHAIMNLANDTADSLFNRTVSC